MQCNMQCATCNIHADHEVKITAATTNLKTAFADREAIPLRQLFEFSSLLFRALLMIMDLYSILALRVPLPKLKSKSLTFAGQKSR
jgi:hypothetical protein